MDMLRLHGIGGAPIKATDVVAITPGAQDIIKPGGNYMKGLKVVGDSNLISSNIIAGKNIFGVQGSATIESLGGKRRASDTIPTGYSNSSFNYIVNLDFAPALVAVHNNIDGSHNYYAIWIPSLDIYYTDQLGVGTGVSVNGNTVTISSNANEYLQGMKWIAYE